MRHLSAARLLLICLACLASACSWVKLDAGAGEVLVLPADRVSSDCESLGSVTVSVVEKVGVLERHDDEVIEDLNILARNHAARENGDTVVPRGPVQDGARKYEVFRCGKMSPSTENDSRDDIEVIPYEGGSV